MDDMHSEPLFKSVFAEQWKQLPVVFQKRYANRPFSHDVVVIKGNLNVIFSKVMKFFLPITRLLKILVPHDGENIPVIIHLRSDRTLPGVFFDRMFYFPEKEPYRFYSYMQPIKDNVVVEFIRFGIGWRMKYFYSNNTVLLKHDGYVLKVGNKLISLPFSFIFGRINAEERCLSENLFHLTVKIDHPFFGKIFEYNGVLNLESL